MGHLIKSDKPASIVGKRYKIINQLGVGGFGQTFLAQDLHLPGSPRCVVKRLLVQTNDPKHLQTARRLFNTEAKVLYQLGSHDQIPTLFAHLEENQEFYLVQEFIEGEPLTRQIGKGKQWTEPQVVALLKNILEVLAFVHQQNVIHRDIKPSNLMRRRKDGKLVLIDFGAVKQVANQVAGSETEASDLTVSIGTKGYVPNEQLAGKPRFSSDVYAVGLAGIQALTGVSPRDLGENAQTGELHWRIYAPQVSAALADILDQMVRYDFRDRYPTAIDALEALGGLPYETSHTQPELGEAAIYPTVLLESTSAEAAVTQVEESNLNPEDSRNAQKLNSENETLTLVGNLASEEAWQQTHIVQSDGNSTAFQRSNTLQQHLNRRSLILASAIVSLTVGAISLGTVLKPVSTVTSLNSSVKPVTSPSSSLAASPPPSPEQKAKELLNQANQLREQRQYQKALNAYDQVIKLKPKLAQAYWGRCDSLSFLKQPDKAMVACNDALDLQPTYPEALWSKGKVLKQQERSLEALRLFEQATALNPNFAPAWSELGMTLQEFGRSEEAINALDRAISLDRNSAEAWSTRGAALWNLGRFDQAITSLDKALQIQPNAAGARELRQKARQQLGY